ncbi:unnamed protein product [Hyaloperonospora brassicae]|uniref:Helicase-associated domain-containing protein n=1 Tax=Hyaloperonospora brassicae TaxID=162125 RepID=A0AAV0T9H2_HYABA|nr:unnamed protein product [Hyaloperonospora brassicae]
MDITRQPEASLGDALDAMIVNTVDYQKGKWLGVIMPALRIFHSLFGHSDVPEEFVVPRSNARWPRVTWGLCLGQFIRKSNDVKRYYGVEVAASERELQKLGFTWTVTNAIDRSWKHQVLPALRVFYQEHGHCNVKDDFVVPVGKPWPYDAYGLHLGDVVKQIRAEQKYAAQARADSDALEKLGFLWGPRDMEWQECILPALVTFADEFGDAESMTSGFVVPSKVPWPKQTWGLELGMFMNDSQWREQYFVQITRDAHVLKDLGFEVRLSDLTWKRQIDPLLKIYSVVYPGKLTLPEDFVIPHKHPWPKVMWGLELGKIGTQNAHRMADVAKEWEQHGSLLSTVPLVSGNRDQLWRTKIYPALATFVKVFGHCRVAEHFKVPSEHPWPTLTWGLRLGVEIALYSNSGTYFQQIGRDADLLDAWGISFKLLGTPWKRYGAPLLKTFSALHPSTVVPDTFVIPPEAPWRKKVWGIHLGKIVRWNAQHMTDIEYGWRMEVLTAVEVHRKMGGKVPIRGTVVVPFHFPWPARTWGMNLAEILHRFRTGACYDGHVAMARTPLKTFFRHQRDEAWEIVFTALKVFSNHFGHCNIPPHFIFPGEPPWPETVWNLQLGQIVEKMKTLGNFFSYIGRCANYLNQIGFVLALSNAVWEKKVVPLIATFANLHPRDTIPWGSKWGFTIPPKEPWPTNVWGVNLGMIVRWNLIQLETIEHDWKGQVMHANGIYHFENRNRILRDDFVVPARSPWPYKTWGRDLRHIITCVQVGQPYGGHLALADPHVSESCVTPCGETKEWKMVIFPALQTFATVFGHCSISDGFVVPSEFPWPTKTFGLQLGSVVSDMEKHGLYFAEVGLHADRLEAFGFRYNLADEAWKEHVAPLLKTYATRFPHEIIPENFVVPPEPSWPQKLWGVKLGKVVSWSSQFVWNRKQTRWEKRKMPQYISTANGYGCCRVPPSFKVPCELPWPKHMWGLRMRSFLQPMDEGAGNCLYSSLHRALMDEEEFGFFFKLSIEKIVGGEAERKELKADTKRSILDGQKCWLGKRSLADVTCCK